MKEQIIEFETAKLAKERGFDLHTIHYYNSDNPLSHNIELKERGWGSYKDLGTKYEESGLLMSYAHYLLEPINNAPTQSLLQKWLREIHDINITIKIVAIDHHSYTIHGKDRRYITTVDNLITHENFKSNYEDTLEKGLYQALKLIN